MIQKTPEPKNASIGYFHLILVAIFGASVLVLLHLLSFGTLFWPFAITLVMALVGLGHYVLWGHDLSVEVAEERERFLRQQAREQEDQDRLREM